jgi:hypothetical protein
MQMDSKGDYFIGTTDYRHAWLNGGPGALLNEPEAKRMLDVRSNGEQGGLIIGSDEPGKKWGVKLINYPHKDFHPHGLYFLEEDTFLGQESALFVINHRANEAGTESVESVSVFSWDAAERTATWVKDFEDPLFKSINDVVAVSKDEIYVTNWREYPPESPMHLLEVYLQLPTSYIVRCTAKGCEKVADGLRMANGIMVNKDGSKIYVAGSIAKDVREYARDEKTGALTLLNAWPVDQLPDNLSWKDEKTLIVAGHPKGLDFQKHSRDPYNTPGPCQVESIDITTGVSTVIYVSKGEPMNACSIALIMDHPEYGKSMLLGGVFDNGVVNCEGEY